MEVSFASLRGMGEATKLAQYVGWRVAFEL